MKKSCRALHRRPDCGRRAVRPRRPAHPHHRHRPHSLQPGDTIALPVRDTLAALPVQTESRTGYERTKFRHCTDADRDGCSTRNEVHPEEAVTPPEQDASCRLTGGSWYSPYDDTYFTAARSLDIDHLVPLAEAETPAPPPGRRRNAARTPMTSTTRGHSPPTGSP
ncbi:hypothetical protein ACFYSF_34710 [Streptomyces canus]|uniref:hypothetical protein n=1 Tax=Streptomyces canus TaxID=58343 RepID=UPI0036B8421C